MSNIKTTTIILLSWFIALFSINTLTNGQIEIPAFAQVLAVAIGAAILLLPQLSRSKLMISGAVALIIFSALYFVTGANGSLINIAASIVALEVSVILTHILSKHITKVDRAAQVFAMGSQHIGMVAIEEGEEKLNAELYRARRLERPMTVVYCELNANDAQDITVETNSINYQITRTFRHRFQQMQMAKLVASLTYKDDIIIEFGDRIIIGLAETDAPEAATFVNRLGNLVNNSMGLDMTIGTAIFPDNGLMAEDLIHNAQRNATTWQNVEIEDVERAGSVMLEVEERLKIEQQMAWVNDNPVPTATSRKVYNALKRAFDVSIVMILLPTILPVFVMLALVIWFDDRGPIFYKQWRTGYGGKRFQMYKFRSMVVNAPVVAAKAVTMPDGSVRYLWPEKNGKDPRITRIGHIIRKTSLDELPQLLNVLKGDMTLVGPRPTTWDLDKYTRHQTARLAARPGITGLWQVSARDATNFDERLLWDMKYIDRANLWLDFQIIWLTVAQVFKRGGV